MVLSVFLHMARVFYHGAYKSPREFNWVIGIILLLLTLLLSFTGYLLPWDQLSLWAVTVGTNMMGYTPVFGDNVKYVLLGSKEIGSETLLRWYVLHVLMLPFVIVIFMAVHFWRVRKDGGISGSALGRKEASAWPRFPNTSSSAAASAARRSASPSRATTTTTRPRRPPRRRRRGRDAAAEEVAGAPAAAADTGDAITERQGRRPRAPARALAQAQGRARRRRRRRRCRGAAPPAAAAARTATRRRDGSRAGADRHRSGRSHAAAAHGRQVGFDPADARRGAGQGARRGRTCSSIEFAAILSLTAFVDDLLGVGEGTAARRSPT